MKKKIALWSLLMLLLGIGTALLPMSGSTVQAVSVRIDDRAKVLDVAQVRDAASKLSQPVYVSTIPKFDGSKGEFIQSVQKTITDQKMIAIGISVEQRYLAIVAGTQVNVHADQISKARQEFSQAYGENAGGNGNYTAATLAALQSLQSSGGAIPGNGLFSRFSGVLGTILLLLIPVLLIGLGVFVSRRLFDRRKEAPKDIPLEQSYTPNFSGEPYPSVDGKQLHNSDYVQQQQAYASRFHDGRNAPIPGNGGMAYDSNYPQQQRGMNPWVAGGLGVLGGGLLGYGVGQAMSGHEQGGADTAYASGEAVPVDVQGGDYPDFGGFSSDGADFGGDFGGGDS